MKKTATFCFLGAMLTIAFISSPYESCACTGFVAHDAGIVLVGNNEDWPEPYSMIWFLPQEKGKYGRVYFGFDSGVPAFGGMNDQGLFFDLYSVPRKPVQTSEHRKIGKKDLILTIMETCATVEEALQVLREYNYKYLEQVQIMLADKTGDAVIIEETDVIHRKQSRYQVVTNFRLSEVQPQDITCWRYKKADALLQEKPVSFESFRDILNAVHQERTQYSNIYDLKNGILHVYHFHDFQHKVVFHLHEELNKGKHSYKLSSLFPDTEEKRAYLRYYKETAKNPFESLPMVVFIIVSALVFLSALVVWPFSSLIKAFNAKRKHQSKVSDSSNLRPIFAWIIASLASLNMLMTVGGTFQFPIIFTYGLPPLSMLTVVEKMIIIVPLIGAILTIGILLSGILAWIKSWWTLKHRIHYSIILLTAVLYCLFLYHYHLLAIRL